MIVAGGSGECCPDPAVIATGDRGSRVAVTGDFALIADGYAGLGVIDLPGSAREVVIRGTTAWVTHDRGGICPIDLRFLDKPVVNGCVDLRRPTESDLPKADHEDPAFWIDAMVFGASRIER